METIDAVVDHFSCLPVDDLVKVCQDIDQNVGQIFLVKLKILFFELALKIKYYNFCTKLYICSKYQGKMSSINLKLFFYNKTTLVSNYT